MRQLISIVRDDRVRFLVDDGEGAHQIAEIINPGFDDRAVVDLGAGLVELLGLNGHKRGAHRQPALKAEAPAPAALPPGPKAKAKVANEPVKRKPGRPKGGFSYPVTRQQCVDYLAANPGATTIEIAKLLLPHIALHPARQAIDNRLRPMTKLSPPQVSVLVDYDNKGTGEARWYLTPAATPTPVDKAALSS
jgi:hypothetical protein